MTHTPSTPSLLAIATSAALVELSPADQQLRALLTAGGQASEVCVWNDPQVDWRRFDAVLIRSIWDYFQHYSAYLAWLDHLRTLGVRTLNPERVLRWNSDKRYLRELAAAGVAIAPTTWLPGAHLAEHLAVQAFDSEWVIKPAVSGGAWHTVRGRVGTTKLAQAVAALPADLEFLVQPYLPEIAALGEWSLLYFGGAYSHAVLKTPAAGDYRVQSQYGGHTQALQPPAQLLAAAQHALAATDQLIGEPLTYARVDGVMVNEAFVLMELELIEPYLFTEHSATAPQMLADAVRAAVQAG